MRRPWLMLLVSCLGCQSFESASVNLHASRAAQLWMHGQEELQAGHYDEAIHCYEQSLEADPSYTQNHLSLAAAWLEKGDARRACALLSRYVETHPAHLVARGHLGELLLRLDRLPEARTQFERFEADAQELGTSAVSQRIHCHGQLAHIAEAEEDAYAEHLNRGIGLFLLAEERAAGDDQEDVPFSYESILCKSVGELLQAHALRPDEARPSWYLYEAWSSLAQRQPALRCLHDADGNAPFTFLTATEQRNLLFACQRERKERMP